jgi:hypothetical protein
MKIACQGAPLLNCPPQATPNMARKMRMAAAVASRRCTLRRREIDPLKNSRKQ